MGIKKRFGQYSKEELDRFDETVKSLMGLYEDFKTDWLKITDDDAFELNTDIIGRIVIKYLHDLKEFTVFHNAKGGTDHYKRAAYLSIHIAIEKPIYFKVGNSKVLRINAEFALYTLCAYLNIRDIDALMDNSASAKKVLKNLMFVFGKSDIDRDLLNLLCVAMEAAFVNDRL